MIKRFIGLRVGLAGLLVMLGTLALGVGSASAATNGDTATCTFTGVTGTLGQTIPTGASVFDSTYTFGGSATCVGTDAPGEGLATDAPSDMFTVNIKSDGYFTNLACGTGSVSGTAGIGNASDGDTTDVGTGTPPASNLGSPANPPYTTFPFDYNDSNGQGGDYATTGFGVDFKNSSGPIKGGVVSPDGDSATTTGSVTITPVNTGGCVTAGVSQFNVAGSFSTAE